MVIGIQFTLTYRFRFGDILLYLCLVYEMIPTNIFYVYKKSTVCVYVSVRVKKGDTFSA